MYKTFACDMVLYHITYTFKFITSLFNLKIFYEYQIKIKNNIFSSLLTQVSFYTISSIVILISDGLKAGGECFRRFLFIIFAGFFFFFFHFKYTSRNALFMILLKTSLLFIFWKFCPCFKDHLARKEKGEKKIHLQFFINFWW